jgi:hypothetical protein
VSRKFSNKLRKTLDFKHRNLCGTPKLCGWKMGKWENGEVGEWGNDIILFEISVEKSDIFETHLIMPTSI